MVNRLIGVEENYCDVAYCEEFLVITDTDDSVTADPAFPRLDGGGLDPIKGMYYRYNQSQDPLASGAVSGSADSMVPPEDILSGHSRSGHDEREMAKFKASLNSTYGTRINLLMATAMKAACGVDANMALKINARFKRGSRRMHVVRFASSPIIASKVPGFYFSAHSQVATMMTAVTTLPEFDYLLQTVRNHTHSRSTIDQPPQSMDAFPFNLKKQQLLIRMRNGTNLQDRTEIVDLVSSLCETDFILITDTEKTIDGVNKTTNLLSIFFSAVAVLTMFLCFFISFISFQQNVNENIYQFGVLRSIGINKVSIVFLFVFESITITISSLGLGTAIGITQSVILTLQSQILTENIFEFEFPIFLYLVLVTASTVIAIRYKARPLNPHPPRCRLNPSASSALSQFFRVSEYQIDTNRARSGPAIVNPKNDSIDVYLNMLRDSTATSFTTTPTMFFVGVCWRNSKTFFLLEKFKKFTNKRQLPPTRNSPTKMTKTKNSPQR